MRIHLFVEVLQLINEKRNDGMRTPPFATPSEIMDPGIEHQQLLTSQKGRRANIMCLLMKNTPPAIVLPKGSNLSLIKPLDPAINLQEVQSSEEHIELFLEYTISKIQTVGNITG